MGDIPAGTSGPVRQGHYPYRTTTEQLASAVEHVNDGGGIVLSHHHVGGRDWVLICAPRTTPRLERLKPDADQSARGTRGGQR